MANGQIQRLLEFVRQQMAAEAFLSQQVDPVPNRPPENVIGPRLVEGNTHASKFMPDQAAKFTTDYEVLAQYRNDPQQPGGAGFSGTLFRCKVDDPARGLVAGELTLSFRSTEFIDDAVRDSKSTTELEIKELGWAFGQIAEMEQWYAQLREDPNLLGGRTFNVTGYSLGGHLATAFNILRREEAVAGIATNPIIATYTFNGAGTGGLTNGRRLSDVLADFIRFRDDPNLTASGAWVALPLETRNQIYDEASSRANRIEEERVRLQTLQAPFAFDTRPPAGSQATVQYQLAALLAARDTVGASNFPFPGGTNWIPSGPVFADPDQRFANMIEIVGSDGGNLGPSFVSNSGIHYGYRQEIYIEDQPLVRGAFPFQYILGFNFLVSNPDANNFADTHSLVLLVDSLSLLAAMESIDPNFTAEAAREIFSAASHTSADSALGTQGQAEGDTLERVLDAIRAIMVGPNAARTVPDYEATLVGNSWHSAVLREPFHANLQELNVAIGNAPGPRTLSSLVNMSAAELVNRAQGANGSAYRYALKELNPFAILGPDALYTAHNANGVLNLYDPTADVRGGMTSEYIADRASFLRWKNLAYTNNVTSLQDPLNAQSWRYIDLPQKLTLGIAGAAVGSASPEISRWAVFGGDGADALHGGTRADRLYGGGGTDVLVGKSNDDHLEGGSGLDVYQFNASAGLTNDGNDTLRDTDGKGVLRYTYTQSGLLSSTVTSTVIADASDPQPDGTWRSADGKFGYAKFANDTGGTDLVVTINGDAGGSLTLKDFRDGDFAIRPRGSVTAPQDPVRTFYGDKENWDSDSNQDGIQPAPDGFGNYIRADGQSDGQIVRPDIPLANRVDEFFGSTANEVERFTTAGGNDSVFADGATGATGGTDLIDTGAGRDIVWAGPGDDFIEGGSDGESIEVVNGQTVTVVGGDVVNAGAGDDALYGLVRIELPNAIRNAETDVSVNRKGDFLSAWDGNDRLIGATENDALLGGAGEDVLVGGAGDDNLWGDLAHGANTLAWTATRSVTPQGDVLLYQIQLQNVLEAPIPEGAADALYGGAGVDWSFGGGGDDFIDAGSGNDVGFGEAGADILVGGVGNDFLVGDNGPGGTNEGGDFLDGGAGNDTLQGDGGDDVLIGGPGEDVLMGGAGKDIYVFSKGDGTEIVQDTSTDDPNNVAERSIVVAGDGINPADVKFRPGSLMVDFGAGDAIHFQGFDQFNPANSPLIDEIRFADGSSISYADILAQGFDLDGTEENDDGHDADHPQLVGTGVVDRIRGYGGDDLLVGLAGDDMLDGGDGIDELQGGDGNDSLVAGAGADLLFGEAGADTLSGGDGDDQLIGGDGANTLAGDAGADSIWGGTGDDTLAGGAGDDVLQGDTGNDAYLFSRGDGLDLVFDQDATAGNVDRVEFAADITPDDVTATRGPVYASDLVLTINGGAGELTIANQFSADTSWQVEEIRFADGTVWTPAATPMLIRGNTSNNYLPGTSGPDVFEGLAGNDTLSGGAGNDVYRFYRGDGQDVIADYDTTAGNVDKVLFAADIVPTDVKASHTGSDLVLKLTGTTDQVTVANYFQDDGATPFSVEQIKFAFDGTIWDVNAVKQLVLAGTPGNDSIIGFAGDDAISGLDGNDTLDGAGGNDTIYGGNGRDVIHGGAGADTLSGNTGNDITFGETGNDTYLFGRTDGQDYAYDIDSMPGNVDTLVLTGDIVPSEVIVRRTSGNSAASFNMRVFVGEALSTSPSIEFDGAFSNDGATPNAVERIVYESDGTVWDLATLKARALLGTDAQDTIIAFDSDDLVNAAGGDDTVLGRSGNDTLSGGTGDDLLEGALGNDTFLYAVGDGSDAVYDFGSAVETDVLRFGAGIAPADVALKRSLASVDDLFVDVLPGGAGIRVLEQYDSGEVAQYGVERIEFADGTVWDRAAIRAGLLSATAGADLLLGFSPGESIDGLAGNDTIESAGGNDMLRGNTGQDYLSGGLGDDTYFFDLGDGQDVISDRYGLAGFFGDGADTLILGSGITPANVTATQSLSDLRIAVNGTSDFVLLKEYFWADVFERIQFGDGTIWTPDTVAAMFPITGTSGDDSIFGTSLSDTISALAGNDLVQGVAGDDTINGGLGSDRLYGGAGNDMLIGGTGEAKNASVSNSLYGEDGDDILIAGGNAKSAELLDAGSGNNILLGGSGPDRLTHSLGNSVLLGGAGADTFDTYSGANSIAIGGAGGDSIRANMAPDVSGAEMIIAFNKSDGTDSASQLGQGSTISLGGGTLYSNLSLEVVGSGLRLKTGSNNYVYLSDWYSGGATVARLQIVIEGTRDYNANSSNPMNNAKIQVFDFVGLVTAFDAARAAGKNFNVANNLPNFRLWSSDTQAIGGAVAYQYARTGSIGALSYDQMRAVISAPEFASVAQPISVSVSASDSTIQESPAAQEMSFSASLESLDAEQADTGTLLSSSEARAQEIDPDKAEFLLSSEDQAQATDPGAATVAAMIEDQSGAESGVDGLPSLTHTPGTAPPLRSPIVMPASAHAPSPLAGSGAEHTAATQTAAAGQLRASAASSDSGTALQWDQPAGAFSPAPAGAAESEDGVSPRAATETPRASGLGLRFTALLDGWLARARNEQPIALSDFDDVRTGVTGNPRSAREASSYAAAWNRVARNLPTHLERHSESGFVAPAGFAGLAFGPGLLGAASPAVAAIGLPDAGSERLRQFEGLKEGIQLLI